LANAKYYVWEESLLYKMCGDGFYRRCLSKDEVHSILTIAMLQLIVETLVRRRPLPKYFKRASISLLSSKMEGSLL